MQSDRSPTECKPLQEGARARKMEALIRQRVMSVGQAEIARRTCKDESKISRLMNGDLQLVTEMLEIAGLKVLPGTAACVESVDKLNHLLYWARIGMDSVKSGEDLLWGDQE